MATSTQRPLKRGKRETYALVVRGARPARTGETHARMPRSTMPKISQIFFDWLAREVVLVVEVVVESVA